MRARGLHDFLKVTDFVGPVSSPGEFFNNLPGVSTMETHCAHLKEKLAVQNGVELTYRAAEWFNHQRK